MELEITWGRILRVWWEYLWRSILTWIGLMVASVFVGIAMGIVMSYTGSEIEALQPYIQAGGFLAALLSSIIPIGLILGKTFGRFRLVLVDANDG